LEEVPTEAAPNDAETLPPPADMPKAAPSAGEPAPLPKTATRGVRASSFAAAPVGPKSDGRSRRPASGSAASPGGKSNPSHGGAKPAKFDWGNVGADATETTSDEAAAPLPKTTGQSSRGSGNVLRQQTESSRTDRRTENRTLANVPGPNPTTAAIARPSSDRTGT
jgi:hypothetical protein